MKTYILTSHWPVISFMAAILRFTRFNSAVESLQKDYIIATWFGQSTTFEIHLVQKPWQACLQISLLAVGGLSCFGGNKQEWILCYLRSAFIFGVTWPLKLSINNIITAALSSPSDSLLSIYGTTMLSTYWIMVSSVDHCLGEWVMFQSSEKLKCGRHRSVLPL